MTTPPQPCKACKDAPPGSIVFRKWAVIGSDLCVSHGGRVPKTIAEGQAAVERARQRILELDEEKIIDAQFYTSPGVPAFTAEPKDDRLKDIRRGLNRLIDDTQAILETVESDPEYADDGYYWDGRLSGLKAALRIINSEV